MLPSVCGLGKHFQGRGHSFLLHGPTLSRKITDLIFPAVNWLTAGLFTQLSSRISLRAVYWQKRFALLYFFASQDIPRSS